ncbi:hypothetical protein KXR53_13715 [Inquilinus limosus]|uniref:hypothetical protein n=1 Tax=Inquilinus limosus TaxID=171674 RepID=UPI003F153A2B
MATGIDISGLIKWGQRDDWKALWEDVFLEHVRPGCDSFDLEPDELMAIIGEHHFMMLWRCAFEDFLTRSRESDGQTIAADYIKRRGWRETVPTKRYIGELETSLGLYEVSDIVPGNSFLARDLIRGGGEPIRVSERREIRTPERGDRIGARLIEYGGRTITTGGVLVFDAEAADRLLDVLAEMQKRMQQELGEIAKNAGKPQSVAAARSASQILVSMRAAPVFSRVWLEHNIPRLLGLQWPTIVNDAPEPSDLSSEADERFRDELDAYYREMLDLPMRMLGGMSPREAARTAEGKEKVVTWLRYLESHRDSDDALVSYDFSWMWEELGVLDRRR